MITDSLLKTDGTVDNTEQAKLDSGIDASPRQCRDSTQLSIIDGLAKARLDTKEQQATQSASSSIATMPFEILSHIFVIYTYADLCVEFKLPSSSAPHKSRGPLHVCSVSKQWRHVALTTPSLWSSFFVRQNVDLRLIRLWLERSHSHPLALGLAPVFYSDETPEDFRFTEAALLLFTPQFHRWRRICFDFRDSTAQAFINLPLSTATLLDEVILFTNRCDPKVSTSVFAALSACPSIRHLTWTGNGNLTSIPKCTFWSQLDSLDLHCSLSVDECITLLRLSYNISRLSLWNMSDGSLQNNHPHTTLPHLQKLILHGYMVDSSKVFDYFTMPALQYLWIDHHSIENCYNNFRALLDRSHCRLEKFKLVDYAIAQSDLINFFQDPLFRSIPRLYFEVSSLFIDHHACLATSNGNNPSSMPAFEVQCGGGISIYWGEQL
ncbi:hypothetical protein B0H34DRAFT_707186 [Crassisporium funariophilum]|nr:hypothetical protein B0H34DRAFT_707186 [Crassisporium funariophilum]